jgi:hypothetical protein
MSRLEKRRKQCDRSGGMFEELHKQYEWAGNEKVWTGLFVGDTELDELQEQNKTPLVKGDPRPVKDPRPFTTQSVTTLIAPGVWPLPNKGF